MPRPDSGSPAPGRGALGPVRVGLVHRDAHLRARLTAAFPAGEFEVRTLSGIRELLADLDAAALDVILVEIDQALADSRFFEVGTRGGTVIPVVAIAGVDDAALIGECLAYGADDVLVAPAVVEVLPAKLRALLRLTRNAHTASRRPHFTSGAIGELGTPPVLKHCEDQRLTGRLTVKTAQTTWWVDFLGGSVLDVGGSEPAPSLEGLLAVARGTFVIEQAPLVPLGDARLPCVEVVPEIPPADALLPEGRTSQVVVAQHLPPYRVETACANRPHFTVTTTVWRGQEIVRRVRTSWQHALSRADDVPRATSQTEEQHERTRRSLMDLVARPAPAGTPAPHSIDGMLLTWAMHFIVEQAWGHLGTTITGTLLRRTHQSLLAGHPALVRFRVGDPARVELDAAASSRLPLEAVASVAEWTAAFLSAGRQVVSDVGRVNVRQATALMAHALESVGFYAAYDRAVERSGPPRDTVSEVATRSKSSR
jgi:DNA-binding response OmpR family regulator